MGFSPPKDSQNLSLEEKKNSYLNSQATNVLFDVVSNAVNYAIMPFYNSNEFWTKIQDDVSNIIEMIVFPPLLAVIYSYLLHQSLARHKVTIW
jgi:hypothetical protein